MVMGMAKCIDCLHFEVCKHRMDEICKFTNIEDLIHNCSKFTDRTKYAEVVHAHWEDGCAIHNGKEVYKSIDCSHCEGVFKIESETREYWKNRFKVCPFCGALMDGDGNG